MIKKLLVIVTALIIHAPLRIDTAMGQGASAVLAHQNPRARGSGWSAGSSGGQGRICRGHARGDGGTGGKMAEFSGEFRGRARGSQVGESRHAACNAERPNARLAARPRPRESACASGKAALAFAVP